MYVNSLPAFGFIIIGERSPLKDIITWSVSVAFIASSINLALKPNSILSPVFSIQQVSLALPIVVAQVKFISSSVTVQRTGVFLGLLIISEILSIVSIISLVLMVSWVFSSFLITEL